MTQFLEESDEPVEALGSFVRGDGSDDVTDPPEESARAYPQARRDDQPEQTAPEVAVVELADTGDQDAQDCG